MDQPLIRRRALLTLGAAGAAGIALTLGAAGAAGLAAASRPSEALDGASLPVERHGAPHHVPSRS